MLSFWYKMHQNIFLALKKICLKKKGFFGLKKEKVEPSSLKGIDRIVWFVSSTVNLTGPILVQPLTDLINWIEAKP